MAVRTPRQLATQRCVERFIRLAAPALDLLLFAGHHLSRAAGRNAMEPEPPRRSTGSRANGTPIGLRGADPPGEDHRSEAS